LTRGTVFIGLLLLLVVLAATCAVVVGGGVLAFRAGRGSTGARKAWVVLEVVGLLIALAMIPEVLEGRLYQPFGFVSAILITHGVLYLGGRATSAGRLDGRE
jgi:hypothetical protein